MVYLLDTSAIPDSWEGAIEFRTVVNVTSHPFYNKFSNANYFAIHRLNAPPSQFELVNLNNDMSYPTSAQTSHVMGWGTMPFRGNTSEVPLEVDLSMIDNDDCATCNRNSIETDKMCTFDPGHDSCQGDSGERPSMQSHIVHYFSVSV